MSMPGFTAEASVGRRGNFGTAQRAVRAGATVVPAIPFCDNCYEILERCARNGGRPRAVCNACLEGHCYSGVERPPHLLQPGLPPHFW
jgi:hypothetical protein